MPPSPIELPGWVEFNAWRAGLTPREYTAEDGGAELRAILYLDRRGRIHLPDLARYVPVTFVTQRRRASGQTAEWLRAAAPLAEEMRRRAVPRQVHLPPEVDDVRPWQWRGFVVGVDYTYVLDLPTDPERIGHGHKSNLNKAIRLGMTVERVDEPGPVVACLGESASRVGYELEIHERELAAAARMIGDDAFRMYVCRDAAGAPASSAVVVHVPGSVAFAWLTGTSSARLADGAGHRLWQFVFEDLAAAGATGVDLGGPNSPAIAAFKARWGARLLPMYGVRTYSVRAFARFLADWRSARDSRDDRVYRQ